MMKIINSGKESVDLTEVTDKSTPHVGSLSSSRLSRLKQTGRLLCGSVAADYRSDEYSKIGTASWGALTAGTQIIDRLRLGVVLIPPMAVEVMEQTHNSLATAAVTGAAFTAWNVVVGSAFGQGISRFPRTNQTVTESFPRLIDTFNNALPGMEKPAQEQKIIDPIDQTFDQKSSRFGRFMTHIRRSFSVMGIGTTAYAGTAAVNGHTPKDVLKINAVASADGGALAAVVAGGAAESVMQLASSGHPELALDVQNFVGDSRLWLGVAAVSMAAELWSNRRKS